MAMGVGPLTHYALAALGPFVVDDLDLSVGQYGQLWLVVFAAASVATTAGGWLADRMGLRGLFIATFAVSGLATIGAASAAGFLVLIVALVLSGVAQALANPATNRYLLERVDPRRRGSILGIKQSGVQASQLMAGLLLPPLAMWWGWRNALAVCCAVAIVGILATVPATGGPGPRRSATSSGSIRHGPEVAWLFVYAFAAGAVAQATNVYLPLFAHVELDLSASTAGLVVAVLGGVGVVARFLWGRGVQDVRDLRTPMSWLSVITVIALVGIMLTEQVGAWLVWPAAGLFGFSALAANVLVMVAVLNVTPADSIGRATGRVSLGLFLGFMCGPPSAGLVVERLGYPAMWMMLMAIGGFATVIPLAWRTRTPHLVAAA
ncbi:MFS transporter [Solicola gregarius]|uniref:MFS transporter n=1 Tax=Solicola gregarius TaxID=2908642 RepID=A0AA46YLD5_9ACTN|nr:MFS transporter [Solicola gregarius]UYM05489.1 MFS transporter [Solicola gregarius]UYM05522.1 MFS transporter [Solicola gregarius]